MYINKAKKTDSSVDFGNHRNTNGQNGILFICKCDLKKVVRGFAAHSPRKMFFAPPPPQSQNRSYALVLINVSLGIGSQLNHFGKKGIDKSESVHPDYI